jgi:site-specific DNA-methyltransferase (adenine-specific)
MKINEIYLGDCLELMPKHIEDKSIDCIICDLPYGSTQCKWDEIIPIHLIWNEYNRIIKDGGAIVLFGAEPFSSLLRVGNIKNFKYDWIWNKKKAGNFRAVKSMPLMDYEKISVFNHSRENYNPQMTTGKERKKGGYYSKHEQALNSGTKAKVNNLYYPKGIIEFSKANNKDSKLHPTQKPVELIEYLIKTYTKEGETVLDNTMGSGSTGVACVNTNRNFTGIEKDENYFNIAEKRIREAGHKLF